MKKNLTFHKKKVWTIFLLCAVMMLGLAGRLVYLMGVRADYYSEKAQELHERERPIKAARGKIVEKFLHQIRLSVRYLSFTARLRSRKRSFPCCRRNWNYQKIQCEKK